MIGGIAAMNLLGPGQGRVVRMCQSPSIVPGDGLNRDIYLMLEDFRQGPAWRETDEPADLQTVIDDLLSGQYDQRLRVRKPDRSVMEEPAVPRNPCARSPLNHLSVTTRWRLRWTPRGSQQ